MVSLRPSHGFAVLSQEAVFAYKCDALYSPQAERGMRFDEIEEKLGLDTQYDYYIAFAYSTKASGNKDYLKFIEYLFGKC